jgi:hypothetical protein
MDVVVEEKSNQLDRQDVAIHVSESRKENSLNFKNILIILKKSEFSLYEIIF